MLTPKQKKCVELMVRGDMTQREISRQLDLAEETISRWKKGNPEFMAEYEAMLRSTMQSVAAKAFRTQTDLLSARSEMVRYMAAKDILDRAGYKADDKIKIDSTEAVQIINNIPEAAPDG